MSQKSQVTLGFFPLECYSEILGAPQERVLYLPSTNTRFCRQEKKEANKETR
jgi:hypothetical protein